MTTTPLSYYTAIDVVFKVLEDMKGDLGLAMTLDSVAAGYVASAANFQNSTFGDAEFQDSYGWRYNLATSDDVRLMGLLDIAGGNPSRLAQNGASYGNFGAGADLDFILLRCHPNDLMACLKTAQRSLYLPIERPATAITDGDMGLSGVEYWDGTLGGSSAANLVPTKTTDPANVDSGTQSLALMATAASGALLSAKRRVQAGSYVNTWIKARADVGTLTFKMWDATNGAYINASEDKSYDREGFAYIGRRDLIPTGCEEIQLSFGLTGASDLAFVDAVYGPFADDEQGFDLPWYQDQGYKLPEIYTLRLGSPIQGLTGIYSARNAVKDVRYEDRIHYSVQNFSRAANPYRVGFANGVKMQTQWPMLCSAEVLAADIEPITSPTTQLQAPFQQMLQYTLVEVYKMFGDEAKSAEAKRGANQQTLANLPPAPQPTRRIKRGNAV